MAIKTKSGKARRQALPGDLFFFDPLPPEARFESHRRARSRVLSALRMIETLTHEIRVGKALTSGAAASLGRSP